MKDIGKIISDAFDGAWKAIDDLFAQEDLLGPGAGTTESVDKDIDEEEVRPDGTRVIRKIRIRRSTTVVKK